MSAETPRDIPQVVRPSHLRARLAAAIVFSVTLLTFTGVTVTMLFQHEVSTRSARPNARDGVAALAIAPPALQLVSGEHRKLPSACEVVPTDVTMCLGKGTSALREGPLIADRKSCRWSPDRRLRRSSRVYRLRYELFRPDSAQRRAATAVARAEFGERRRAAEDSSTLRRIGDEAYYETFADGSARVVARDGNVIVTSEFRQPGGRERSDTLVTTGTVNAAKAAVRELG